MAHGATFSRRSITAKSGPTKAVICLGWMMPERRCRMLIFLRLFMLFLTMYSSSCKALVAQKDAGLNAACLLVFGIWQQGAVAVWLCL